MAAVIITLSVATIGDVAESLLIHLICLLLFTQVHPFMRPSCF
jgi:hypothetical protein